MQYLWGNMTCSVCDLTLIDSLCMAWYSIYSLVNAWSCFSQASWALVRPLSDEKSSFSLLIQIFPPHSIPIMCDYQRERASAQSRSH